MKKKVAWRSQRFSCLPFPAPDVDGARVAHSLSLGGNAYLAQQVHKWIIALSIPQEGRLKPWGRRGFCKTVKVSARQGVFLFFPRCLHALVPHKVWFSLAAFSHTDDLVLLSTAEAWRVCALTGRGWEATEKLNFESAVATLRNEGVISSALWKRPWREMSPAEAACCFLLTQGIQINSGSSIQSPGTSPISSWAKPGPSLCPLMGSENSSALAGTDYSWNFLHYLRTSRAATLGLMLPLLHPGNLFPFSLRDQRNWSRPTL